MPFLLLLLLVQQRWAPLRSLDQGVAAGLNAVVSEAPLLAGVSRAVTELGSTGAAVLVTCLLIAFLLIRGQRRLAAWVAVTGAGLAVLVPVTKALVDRARPVVDVPLVQVPTNPSFPSGHATVAAVTWGAVLLLVLPTAPRRARPWLVAATALLVLAVGVTRLALGVHFVSDVLAGWALGAGWLTVTAAAFRGWQHETGPLPPDDELDPLAAEGGGMRLAPSGQRVLPAGRATVARLATAALALLAVLVAAGLLVAGPLSRTPLGRWDRAAVQELVRARTVGRTEAAEIVGMLAGTPAVVAVGVSALVLALAVTGSWRPAVFVVVTIAGEVLLYAAAAETVRRARPAVVDLTAGLPSAASWPSGHAAAAAAVYGAVAVLVVGCSRRPWRWAAVALPLLVAPAVALSRVYVAAHHPSDVLAGLLLGGVWVLACARYLLPGAAAGRAGPDGSRSHRPVPMRRGSQPSATPGASTLRRHP